MVAGPELSDFRADCLDHPGAVGHGDAAIGGRQPSRHHAQVVEVQGGGMHPHADGARSGITGVGEVHHGQAVEPLLRMSLDSLHGGAPRLREGSHCRTVAIAETMRTAPR